jgi:hypothetical protein
MKRLAVGVVLVMVLALAPASLAAGNLAGKFESVQSGGTWMLKFTKGAFKAYRDGTLEVSGTDVVKGHQVTLKDSSCGSSEAGKYKYKLAKKKLTFTKISDPCAARSQVILHTWTKVS